MIPFAAYKKEYLVNKSLSTVEKRFGELEHNPGKFYHEINGKLLDAALKKYRFFVPVYGWSIFNVPFTFSRTTMTVRLFEQDRKTKIEAIISTNPVYLLIFVLTVTGLIVNYSEARPANTAQGIFIYIICMLAAIIIDRISKQILSATFERFI